MNTMSNAVIECETTKSNNPVTKPSQFIDGTEYSIYNYFRQNTAFTIACISALVAVTTFVFKYATVLYNSAYLHFWDVDVVYAKQEDVGIFYTTFAVFVYYFFMTCSQVLMGNTFSVYEHYNKVFLVWKELCRTLRKRIKQYRQLRRRHAKRLKRTKSNTQSAKQLEKKISAVDAKIAAAKSRVDDKKAMRLFRARLIINIAASSVISILLCLLGAFVLTFSYGRAARSIMIWVLAVLPVIIAFGLHLLTNRRKVKSEKFMENEWQKYKREVEDEKMPLFPMEGLLHKGLKYHLSNAKLGAFAFQYVATIFLCVLILASSGKTCAEQKKEFPIWTDGVSTYAVIYNNGEQVVLEGITINGEYATINTSIQRVIVTDDISFVIQSFEEVRVDSNGGENNESEGNEPDNNEPGGSISGTARQPKTSD